MKVFLILFLVLQASDCGDISTQKPSPKPPESGQSAIRVDGSNGTGILQKQTDGTYLLKYPIGKIDKVSANEVVMMPESK